MEFLPEKAPEAPGSARIRPFVPSCPGKGTGTSAESGSPGGGAVQSRSIFQPNFFRNSCEEMPVMRWKKPDQRNSEQKRYFPAISLMESSVETISSTTFGPAALPENVSAKSHILFEFPGEDFGTHAVKFCKFLPSESRVQFPGYEPDSREHRGICPRQTRSFRDSDSVRQAGRMSFEPRLVRQAHGVAPGRASCRR